MMALLRRPILVRSVLALGLVLLSAGCETPATSYAPASEPGGYGLTETRINDQSWEISFSGNRFTTREQVEHSVLYRAAQIAQTAGTDGFIVLKEEVERDERSPGPEYAPYYPHYNFGYYGYYGYPSRYAHLVRPLRPYYGRPGEEFTVTMRIRLFSGSPPADLGTPYNAAEVLSNLRPTIAPPPPPPANG